MRLIDADAKIVAQLYDDEHEDWILKEMTVADYLSFSDTSIPFIDAVPVVRCKDCKYHNYDKVFGGYWCEHPFMAGEVNPDFYCGYGEE